MNAIVDVEIAMELNIWLPQDVAERLRAAARTLRRLPMDIRATPAGFICTMPELVKDFWEMWNQLTAAEREVREERVRDINRTRVIPTSQQITEMDEALAWLLWLKDPRNRQVAMGVARGHSYRRVSRFDGRDHKTIKVIWKGSCEQIAERLS